MLPRDKLPKYTQYETARTAASPRGNGPQTRSRKRACVSLCGCVCDAPVVDRALVAPRVARRLQKTKQQFCLRSLDNQSFAKTGSGQTQGKSDTQVGCQDRLRTKSRSGCTKLICRLLVLVLVVYSPEPSSSRGSTQHYHQT